MWYTFMSEISWLLHDLIFLIIQLLQHDLSIWQSIVVYKPWCFLKFCQLKFKQYTLIPKIEHGVGCESLQLNRHWYLFQLYLNTDRHCNVDRVGVSDTRREASKMAENLTYNWVCQLLLLENVVVLIKPRDIAKAYNYQSILTIVLVIEICPLIKSKLSINWEV